MGHAWHLGGPCWRVVSLLCDERLGALARQTPAPQALSARSYRSGNHPYRPFAVVGSGRYGQNQLDFGTCITGNGYLGANPWARIA